MRICIFASGSGGNCLLLSDGSTHVLVDAGISMRRIEASLREAGIAMSDITGVLITHEHSDHISGLKMLLKYHRVSVYASHTVANRMRGMLPDIDGSLNIIEVGSADECPQYITRIQTDEVSISFDEDNVINIDGEAVFSRDVNIHVIHNAVKLIVPAGMKFFEQASAETAAV